MEGDLIFYQFSRSRVERGDLSDFLSLYAPDKLPEGRRLQEMMNPMLFGIEGWETIRVRLTPYRRFAPSTRRSTRHGPIGCISATSKPRH